MCVMFRLLEFHIHALINIIIDYSIRNKMNGIRNGTI